MIFKIDDSQSSPPFKGGRGDVVDYKSSYLKMRDAIVRQTTPPFIPPQGGTYGRGAGMWIKMNTLLHALHRGIVAMLRPRTLLIEGTS